MATFGPSDDLRGAEFVDVDLRGTKIDRAYLTGVVMRGVDVGDMEIDSPWLGEDDTALWVNGVDVVPFVEAELNRRFPGRSERLATDPDGLRAAWAAVERTWEATLARVAAMPAGTTDVSIDGEWSFAQTLRHLVMATDIWLRQAVQGVDRPLHPLGQPFAEYALDGYDTSVFVEGIPPYDEVLEARAARVAMVRDYLAETTPELLAKPCPHPWAPGREVPAVHCLQTILNEEWEHHRFAVRDLDAIEGGRSDAS